MLKLKDGYKLELQTPKMMNLVDSRKKLIDKTKNGENVWSLEVVEVVLVQCNLTDNPYQQNLKFYILLHLMWLCLTVICRAR